MKTRWLGVGLFLFVASWSTRALADVTITGTVGEIGAGTMILYGSSYTMVRFKLTDQNQTKLCAPNTNTDGKLTGYAWFYAQPVNSNDPLWHEWYSMLLLSKKGATINCTIDANTNCHVTMCTLP